MIAKILKRSRMKNKQIAYVTFCKGWSTSLDTKRLLDNQGKCVTFTKELDSKELRSWPRKMFKQSLLVWAILSRKKA